MAERPPRRRTREAEHDVEGELAFDPVLLEARSLLLYVHGVGERADTKAAVLIAAFTAAIGGGAAALASLLPDLGSRSGAGRWVVVVLVLAGLAFVAVATVLAAIAVRPSLGPEYTPPEGTLGLGDLAYFGRLRKLASERLGTELRDAVEEGRMLFHYAEQIQVNSQLLWRKHVLIRRALGWFGAAGACGLAAIAVWVVSELA